MAQLTYEIKGNNIGLANAIKQSISLVNDLQKAINGLNSSGLGGISQGFKKATESANAFSSAAKKGTQAFKDEQISAALDRLSTKLNVINGNVQLFGSSLQTNKQTVGAFQQALNTLLQNGVDPLDKRITGLKTNINGLNNAISQQKNASAAGGGLFSGLGGQLAGVASGYLSVFAAIAGAKKVIDINAEISDSLADVRRTAGLTADEVNVLNNSLKQIDTRTSLKGLLDIAIIGGQLGIAKDQLAGFTQAIDQISVTLSGELTGGPKEIAESLGILNKVFNITAQSGGSVEKAFQKIGSVILGLGQSGLATGDFLADFGKRVGGVAAQARLSLPVLLSYGAVLQEQGVTSEVAGTAFKKLISSLATNRGKFLAVAQIADSSLTLKKFTDIINNDTQKALSLFFDGLAKGGATTTQFQDLLKSVGLDAARSGQAITALALHQADLNIHIQDSVEQFKQGTLTAEQFAIKNDTLGASVDKLGNSFIKLAQNKQFTSSLKNNIDAITDFTNSLLPLDDLVNGFAKNSTKGFSKETARQSIITANQINAGNSGVNKTLFDLQRKTPDGFSDQSITILRELIPQYQKVALDAKKNFLLFAKSINSGVVTDPNNGLAVLKQTAIQANDTYKQLVGTFIDVRDKQVGVINSTKELTDAQLTSIPQIRARLKELTELPDSGILGSDTNVRIIALNERLKALRGGFKAINDTFPELQKRLEDILNKSDHFADESGLKGYALNVQKINDKYKDLNKQIDDVIRKGKSDLSAGKITQGQFNTITGTAKTDKSQLAKDQAKQLSDAQITESQRVANEIQRINDEFGVKAEQSRGRELAQIQALYDAELIKANGNAQTLKTLDEDRLKAVIAINDKYLLIEQDLQDKIQSLNDLAQSAIGDSTAIATARINKEWDSRQQAANKYFQQLQEIAKSETDGLSTIAGFNVQGFVKNAISGGQDDTNNKLKKGRQAAINLEENKDLLANEKQAISGFLGDFVSGLENANSQIGANFASVFSGITASFAKTMQSVAINGISKYFQSKLEAAIAGGTKGLSAALQAAIAGAGIAGSIISGITPQTSVVGQGLGGALSGAASGALIGSVIPGIGTVVGGVIGGVVGLLGGILGASKAQKELQAQQLAEQKQQTDLLKASLAYTANVIGRNTNQGVITDLNVGAFGQLTARISGRDLQFVLDRNSNGR